MNGCRPVSYGRAQAKLNSNLSGVEQMKTGKGLWITVTIALLTVVSSDVKAQYRNADQGASNVLTEFRFSDSMVPTHNAMQNRDRKSAWAAGLFNAFVVPGLGNFYAGNDSHGVRHLVIHFTSVGVIVIGAVAAPTDAAGDPAPEGVTAGLVVAGALGVVANWAWSIFSGVADANAANEGMSMGFEPGVVKLASSATPFGPIPKARTGIQLFRLSF